MDEVFRFGKSVYKKKNAILICLVTSMIRSKNYFRYHKPDPTTNKFSYHISNPRISLGMILLMHTTIYPLRSLTFKMFVKKK